MTNTHGITHRAFAGRISAANVAFDDHPNEKRYSDRIETVTVDAMFAWMQAAGFSGSPQALRL